MIHDLLTALSHAGVEALDLDPIHNRLRGLPTTPAAFRAALAAHKADLLTLAHGQRCTIPLADLRAVHAAPGPGVRVMPGGYRGPSGNVHDMDARRLIARLYVLKGQPDEADRILAGDWTRYRAAYGMPEGAPDAD
jgi:hypothetical protein